MSTSSTASTARDAAEFTALFERLSPRVFAYAARHVGPAQADDVVADTFLVAWRRYPELPDEALPWLLVVARRTIANSRRGAARRTRLVDAIGQVCRAAPHPPPTEDAYAERATTLAALDQLSALEREALLLVAWDGLAPADAATVAGCSRRAFEVRLSRARTRLARALAHADRADVEAGRDPVDAGIDLVHRTGRTT